MVARACGLLFHPTGPGEKVNAGDVPCVVAESVEEFKLYRKRSPIENVA